jgi:hypothetical protein
MQLAMLSTLLAEKYSYIRLQQQWLQYASKNKLIFKLTGLCQQKK